MIYRVVPTYGPREPIVYLSICSLVGSVSVMAIKVGPDAGPVLPSVDRQGFGVALKLTIAGNNQLTHISTYVFAVAVVGCILIQMVRHAQAMVFDIAELLQSRARYVLDQRGQPHILCGVHHGDDHRVRHPVSGLQHHQRGQHHLAYMRISHHLHGRLPAQYLERTGLPASPHLSRVGLAEWVSAHWVSTHTDAQTLECPCQVDCLLIPLRSHGPTRRSHNHTLLTAHPKHLLTDGDLQYTDNRTRHCSARSKRTAWHYPICKRRTKVRERKDATRRPRGIRGRGGV